MIHVRPVFPSLFIHPTMIVPQTFLFPNLCPPLPDTTEILYIGLFTILIAGFIHIKNKVFCPFWGDIAPEKACHISCTKAPQARFHLPCSLL